MTKCIYLVCLSGGGSWMLLWLWLTLTPPPPLLEDVSFSPVFWDRNNALLRIGLSADEKYRIRTKLKAVSPVTVQALLLYEDRFFYQHPGVNLWSLLRAAWATYGEGGRRIGGSTLSMQVARLKEKGDTKSLLGKMRQILMALRLEHHYSKEAILEAYFNLAPYGMNIEGIGAAAQIYFHKAPFRLTPMESLALTVIPQNPTKRNPLNGKDFDTARQRLVTRWKTLAPGAQTTLFPSVNFPLVVHSPDQLPFEAPHATMEILHSQGGRASLDDNAFHMTIDLSSQHLVETLLRDFTARGRAYGLDNAAALLVHWPSMEIRALAGSADFHNPKLQGQVDGTRARRSPGSTLKPFIYALALEQGLIHPQTLLADSPRSFGGYNPENFDRAFRGPLPAHEALRASRNLPAIALASQLKDPDLYAFLERAGINFPEEKKHYGLSLVLGGAEVSMRELAQLYAMLPNQGLWRPLRLERNAPFLGPVRLLSPEAAFVALNMLEDPSFLMRSREEVIPLRLKTGTSNGFRDAWTAGIVGPYVLIVWVGHFNNQANPLLVGGEVALPLFTDIARALVYAADNRTPMVDLIRSQRQGLHLREVPVCVDTGDIDVSLCPRTTTTLFIPGVSPVRPSGVYRKILIDRETGLRTCVSIPGRTVEHVWEFWPTDMQRIFARAGINKPAPPPFGPECAGQTGSRRSILSGMSPRIVLPKEGMTYQVHVSGRERNRIPLQAEADADVQMLFWFADNRFLGEIPPGKQLFWTPASGVYSLSVVDDLGRTSKRKLRVEAIP